MKIAVVSDTHRMGKYIKIINNHIKDSDILIHLGDNIEDIEELSKGFKGEVYGVKGNCDFSNIYPSEQILNISGKKIFITHGHNYGVKSTFNNIFYKGREITADIVLFGHTHEHIIFKEEGIIFMNPGSVPLPRSNGRFIGFIEIEEDNLDVYFKKINVT
ncbi:metallophosphoesterase [Clostridium sp. SHJSY1]|uniref:metallophosphoesterase n=1 Tax=Clostridium sp. SHJSY1 TaxID=2942483 RepID=UPI002873FE76|nr:metallophosphoesterase [Clostridium sp. SHJSY1]MDS0528522.1 metallophosphoesterase [Clostridium sp. SHJSY1]